MKKLLWMLPFLSLGLNSFPQSLSSDTLHWVSYKKLTWEDFKGEAIDVPGMSGQTMMVMLAGFKKMSLLFPTKAYVVTVFDRKNSWTKNEAKTRQSLKYYQVMFDLYEVYTRRLRKDFDETTFGLNPNKVFQEKYNAALTALSDRNKPYIKETKMGTDAEAIDKWEGIIHNELKELEEYNKYS